MNLNDVEPYPFFSTDHELMMEMIAEYDEQKRRINEINQEYEIGDKK